MYLESGVDLLARSNTAHDHKADLFDNSLSFLLSEFGKKFILFHCDVQLTATLFAQQILSLMSMNLIAAKNRRAVIGICDFSATFCANRFRSLLKSSVTTIGYRSSEKLVEDMLKDQLFYTQCHNAANFTCSLLQIFQQLRESAPDLSLLLIHGYFDYFLQHSALELDKEFFESLNVIKEVMSYWRDSKIIFIDNITKIEVEQSNFVKTKKINHSLQPTVEWSYKSLLRSLSAVFEDSQSLYLVQGDEDNGRNRFKIFYDRGSGDSTMDFIATL
ncbi:MAG: hypothetical protein MHMPM18_003288 [Marteilia pararefringens]